MVFLTFLPLLLLCLILALDLSSRVRVFVFCSFCLCLFVHQLLQSFFQIPVTIIICLRRLRHRRHWLCSHFPWLLLCFNFFHFHFQRLRTRMSIILFASARLGLLSLQLVRLLFFIIILFFIWQNGGIYCPGAFHQQVLLHLVVAVEPNIPLRSEAMPWTKWHGKQSRMFRIWIHRTLDLMPLSDMINITIPIWYGMVPTFAYTRASNQRQMDSSIVKHQGSLGTSLRFRRTAVHHQERPHMT